MALCNVLHHPLLCGPLGLRGFFPCCIYLYLSSSVRQRILTTWKRWLTTALPEMVSDLQSHNCQRKANSLWVEGPLFPSVTSSHILGAVCISHGLSGHSDTEHSRQTRAGIIFCSAQDSALSTCFGEDCVYLFIYSVSCARSLGAQKA